MTHVRTLKPSVPYDRAMYWQVSALEDWELDIARAVLGATKLDIRRAAKREDLSDVFNRLRPITRRIDEINTEDNRRQTEFSRGRVRKPVNF